MQNQGVADAEAQAKLDVTRAKLEKLKALRDALKSEIANTRLGSLVDTEHAENAKPTHTSAGGVDGQTELTDSEAQLVARVEALNEKLERIQKFKEDGDVSSLEGNAPLINNMSERNVGETLHLPKSPQERKERIDMLRKKLEEISELKKSGELLDANAVEMVASERRSMLEVAALERGDMSVTINDPASEALVAENQRVGEKLKAALRKLEEIDKMHADLAQEQETSAELPSVGERTNDQTEEQSSTGG